MLSRWRERIRRRSALARAPIERVKASWDAFGRHDAMWAILSDPAKRGNKWVEDEFFETGRRDVAQLLATLEGLGLRVGRARALDFGAGLGRLTQAFAEHFDRVDGVDISPAMIEGARARNRAPDRVHFHLGLGDRLPFRLSRFDLVYSKIVLQHVAINYQRVYVREFIRVLEPNGLAVFQTPSRCLVEAGTAFRSPIETPEGTFEIDMNMFPRQDVESTIAAGRGRLLHALPDFSAGEKFESFTYVVTRA